MKKKSVITLQEQEFSRENLEAFLNYGVEIKKKEKSPTLEGKTIITFLVTPNFHAKLGMEVVSAQLKARHLTIDCHREKWQLVCDGEISEEGEHIYDIANVLGRYSDCVAVSHAPYSGDWRKDRQDSIIKALVEKGTMPVLNLGSCLFNPSQALADLLTIRSCFKTLAGWKAVLCWVYAPGFHTLAIPSSFAMAVSKFGMDLTIACPEGFDLDQAILKLAQKNSQQVSGHLEISRDLNKALSGAHIVYAVPWRSLEWYATPEVEKEKKKSLSGWVITPQQMQKTDGGYLMHPLPVQRNIGVREEVLDGNHSLVYDQAENWIHVQKALLTNMLL
jgi:ornithine carbamoyltransferase